MGFTAEQRARGLATRLANKAKRDATKLKRQQRIVEVEGRKPYEEETNGAGAERVAAEDLLVDGFDWEEAPLSEAVNKAADMKREYERVAAILVRRQNPAKAMWTCWSQENKDKVPRSVLIQCLKRGEDGKWKFRDDGRFVIVDGVRTLKPAFCCNYLCYAVYQKYRVTPPARERMA